MVIGANRLERLPQGVISLASAGEGPIPCSAASRPTPAGWLVFQPISTAESRRGDRFASRRSWRAGSRR